jgi:CSLREA domain-containing protein
VLRRLAPLTLVLAVLASPTSAGAATVQVSTQTDENNGCTPASCSLREAIAAAGQGGVVIVPSGTYALNTELLVDHSVTVDGAGRERTIVSGGNTHRVFHIVAGPTKLKDLQVTLGKDTTDGVGAGIWDEATTARLTLDHARVTGNQMERFSSGGVAQTGGAGLRVEGPLTVANSSIDHNQMNVGAGDMVSLTGGAGIYSRFGPVTLVNSEVHENELRISSNTKLFETGGGGMFVGGPGATLDVRASTIADNLVSVQASEYEDNGGGGVYTAGDPLTITNSTLSGNTASVATAVPDNGGGALFTTGVASTLTNVTIAGNSAKADFPPAGDMGGAIYRDGGSMSARNTILAGNTSDVAANDTCFGTIASKGHNIEDRDTCGLAGSGDRTSTPIKLGPLKLNGGPTRTRAIFAGGPAFDTGLACPDRDQRGVVRPAGAGCDRGAFEIALPVARTGGVRKVATSGARLRGSVIANGKPTTYSFLFGPTKAYGRKTTTKAVAGFRPQPASGAAKGLKPATIYHYRVVAKNALGRSTGRDRSLITHMALPSGCVKDRKLTVPLGRPKGTKVVAASASIGKDRVSVASGKDVRRLKLKDLPNKPFLLNVVARLGNGRKVLGSRRYKPC